jgi:hypothetical protein
MASRRLADDLHQPAHARPLYRATTVKAEEPVQTLANQKRTRKK